MFKNSITVRYARRLRKLHPNHIFRIMPSWKSGKAKSFFFLSTHPKLQLFRNFIQKSPKIKKMIRNIFLEINVENNQNFEEIRIGGIKIHFHLPPIYDPRGIGRISTRIFEMLRKFEDGKSAKKEVFFFPALNFCSDAIPELSVIMVHDLIPLYFKDLFPQVVIDEWEIGYRAVATQAKCLIAVSESSKKDLIEKYNIDERKIVTVYNAVYDDKSIQNTFIHRKKTNNTKQRPYFVMLGAGDYHKNRLILLETWDRYPDISEKYDLKIIGKKSSRFGASSNERIQFLGFLDDEEAFRIIANARALLFPSLKEGFGLPPFEVAMLGIPSICSARPAMTEFLEGAALFAEPDSHEQWKEAIITMATNDDLAHSLAMKAKSKAEELTVLRQVKGILKVLTQVAN